MATFRHKRFEKITKRRSGVIVRGSDKGRFVFGAKANGLPTKLKQFEVIPRVEVATMTPSFERISKSDARLA